MVVKNIWHKFTGIQRLNLITILSKIFLSILLLNFAVPTCDNFTRKKIKPFIFYFALDFLYICMFNL